MILNEKDFDPAKVHRRELTAVSMDLRGFTAFSETSEPEEVISVLRSYHAELGILVNRHNATLEHFAGDGVMVFLNDPVEIEDHPMRALELAVALRAAMRPHLEEWRSHGFDLGMGVGIATGYATIGAVGYEGRWEYAAIGTVCNLAARLCAEAKDGQIVVSKRFLSRLGERAEVESLGERPLKGLTRPVAAFNVLALREGNTVGERDATANSANLAALIYHTLPDLNWAGFYWMKGGELVLGAFQGKPACVRIALGRGVCGTAAAERRTIIVPDVDKFPGHIACDSASRSEIVVPIVRAGAVIGVLDVDSPSLNRFDEEHARALERVVADFVQATDLGN
jgi:putative methionine-R-sulfoxide reductase with GAF domain